MYCWPLQQSSYFAGIFLPPSYHTEMLMDLTLQLKTEQKQEHASIAVMSKKILGLFKWIPLHSEGKRSTEVGLVFSEPFNSLNASSLCLSVPLSLVAPIS